MKVRLAVTELEPPGYDLGPPQTRTYELEDKNALKVLYRTFADGTIHEARGEGDSEAAIQLLRGLIMGAGAGRVLPDDYSLPKSVSLYQHNDLRFAQGLAADPSFIFVDPIPRDTE